MDFVNWWSFRSGGSAINEATPSSLKCRCSLLIHTLHCISFVFLYNPLSDGDGDCDIDVEVVVDGDRKDDGHKFIYFVKIQTIQNTNNKDFRTKIKT